MKYHILTPFSREKNMKAILDNFNRPNVIFHPLINSPIDFPNEDWIRPFKFELEKPVHYPCFQAWNKFFEKGEIKNDDYYLFISDDDFLEPEFFEKIKDINSEFIVVSMKRGNHTVSTSGYGINTLNASWRVMGRRGIGTEQIIVKGKYLKSIRFRDKITADGEFIGELWKTYPHSDFTFVPNAFVLFNYLEEGRYDINNNI